MENQENWKESFNQHLEGNVLERICFMAVPVVKDHKELCVKKVGIVANLNNIFDVILDCSKIRTELSNQKIEFENKVSTLKKNLETELGNKLSTQKAEFENTLSTLKTNLETEFQSKLSTQKTEFRNELSGVIKQLNTLLTRFEKQNVGQCMGFNSILKLTLDTDPGDHLSESQIVNQNDNLTKGKII
jgi:hypothetical protein